MLIHKGWFSEIHLYFLKPGHTHEDIDQFFSNYSKLEPFFDCDHPSHFVEKWLPKAYVNELPNVEYITQSYNWKAFFAPYLFEITGHSKPRAFLFKKDSTDEIRMWMKTFPLGYFPSFLLFSYYYMNFSH